MPAIDFLAIHNTNAADISAARKDAAAADAKSKMDERTAILKSLALLDHPQAKSFTLEQLHPLYRLHHFLAEHNCTVDEKQFNVLTELALRAHTHVEAVPTGQLNANGQPVMIQQALSVPDVEIFKDVIVRVNKFGLLHQEVVNALVEKAESISADAYMVILKKLKTMPLAGTTYDALFQQINSTSTHADVLGQLNANKPVYSRVTTKPAPQQQAQAAAAPAPAPVAASATVKPTDNEPYSWNYDRNTGKLIPTHRLV